MNKTKLLTEIRLEHWPNILVWTFDDGSEEVTETLSVQKLSDHPKIAARSERLGLGQKHVIEDLLQIQILWLENESPGVVVSREILDSENGKNS